MTIEATLERIAAALEKIAECGAAHPTLGSSNSTGASSPRRSSKARSTESPPASASTETKPTDSTEGSVSEPSAVPSNDEDLFGEEEQKPTAAKEEVKAPTLDQVRAKMVELQTTLKSKDLALELLQRFTKEKGKVLSALPEENYAKLIAAASASIKAGKLLAA